MNNLPEWAVAAVTLALALATTWMALKTRSVATATQLAAEAAQAEAKASRDTIDELRRDRELAWRPFLALEPRGVVLSNTIEANILLTNVGRGPAVNVIFAYTQDGKWCVSPLSNVAPGSSLELRADPRPHPVLAGLFHHDLQQIDKTYVAVCQDGLGDKLYRFVGQRPGFDVWRMGGQQPDWAKAALQIEPGLAPRKDLI